MNGANLYYKCTSVDDRIICSACLLVRRDSDGGSDFGNCLMLCLRAESFRNPWFRNDESMFM